MAICRYERTSSCGEVWGDWTLSTGIEDAIVKFCRRAFKSKYRGMWIVPIYFDDKYIQHTEKFFSEVGVHLYPRRTDIRAALKEHGIPIPHTDAGWSEVSEFVWRVINSDIDACEREGVEPVGVVVSGLRYWHNRGFRAEVIKGFKEVPANAVLEAYKYGHPLFSE